MDDEDKIQQQSNNDSNKDEGQSLNDRGEASSVEQQAQELYDDLGISKPVPKTKGRPKGSGKRDKDIQEDGNRRSSAGNDKDEKGKDKSGDAHNSGEDGSPTTSPDKKSASKQSDSGEKVSSDQLDGKKVREESEEADSGVRSAESKAGKDSEHGGEENSEGRDDDSREESKEDQGKRPGKSNPKIERRFQRLTGERDAAIQRAEAAEQQLSELLYEKQRARIEAEDPEYTIDDFRKVYNSQGEIVELSPDQAELAWRRWKDGYDKRVADRYAEEVNQVEYQQQEQDISEQLMRKSVEAYDTLSDILDSYPELNSTSPQYDERLSSIITPFIESSIQYYPGTEPGNEEDNKPVVVGCTIQPQFIANIINQIKSIKQDLPLNGLNDSVDVGSSVRVSHGRSSDPMVNQANELFQELGIKKRV